MPSRVIEERLQRNIEALRGLVDSGSQSIVRGTMEGSAISGSRRRYPVPSIGHRSGKLTVTGYVKCVGKGQRGGLRALIVKCECGSPEYTVDRHNFKNFKATRCNVCAKKSSTHTRKLYWGYAEILPDDGHRERLLNRVSSCIARCHTKTCKSYADYGGRGICVHAPWRKDRAEFLRYLITLPGWDKPELDLDRIDNSKGYEPGNLRFATKSENARNKRKVSILQSELDDLRSRVRRAEEQIHNCDKCRTNYRP